MFSGQTFFGHAFFGVQSYCITYAQCDLLWKLVVIFSWELLLLWLFLFTVAKKRWTLWFLVPFAPPPPTDRRSATLRFLSLLLNVFLCLHRISGLIRVFPRPAWTCVQSEKTCVLKLSGRRPFRRPKGELCRGSGGVLPGKILKFDVAKKAILCIFNAKKKSFLLSRYP